MRQRNGLIKHVVARLYRVSTFCAQHLGGLARKAQRPQGSTHWAILSLLSITQVFFQTLHQISGELFRIIEVSRQQMYPAQQRKTLGGVLFDDLIHRADAIKDHAGIDLSVIDSLHNGVQIGLECLWFHARQSLDIGVVSIAQHRWPDLHVIVDRATTLSIGKLGNDLL